MKFKTKKIEEEYKLLKSQGRLIIELAEDIKKFSEEYFDKTPVVTDLLRTMEDQIKLYGYERQSVHLYGRGIDLRSRIYDEEEIEELLEYINAEWIYDPSRPEKKCALYHKISGNVYHFHVQCHPNTKKKNP